MNKEEVVASNQDVINKARAINEMMKSKGWEYYLEIKERRKAAIVKEVFKAGASVKKFEYNRGGVNFVEEIEEELRGCVDDGDQALDNIEGLDK